MAKLKLTASHKEILVEIHYGQGPIKCDDVAGPMRRTFICLSKMGLVSIESKTIYRPGHGYSYMAAPNSWHLTDRGRAVVRSIEHDRMRDARTEQFNNEFREIMGEA